jgi:hypothetical protein
MEDDLDFGLPSDYVTPAADTSGTNWSNPGGVIDNTSVPAVYDNTGSGVVDNTSGNFSAGSIGSITNGAASITNSAANLVASNTSRVPAGTVAAQTTLGNVTSAVSSSVSSLTPYIPLVIGGIVIFAVLKLFKK